MNAEDTQSVTNFFELELDDQQNRLEEIATLAEMLMLMTDTKTVEICPGTMNRIGNMIWQRLH